VQAIHRLVDREVTSVIEDEVRRGRRGRPTVPPSPEEVALAGRREVLERLHRVAVNMETAAVLDLRANRSGNPTLAAVLHERAAQRRRVAERLRAGLPSEDQDAAG
jgi:hypothetical protein